MKYTDINSCFSRISGIDTVLYYPAAESERKNTGLVVMHSDADYLDFIAGKELAKRGFTALCANIRHPEDLDAKFLDVGECMKHLKGLSWIHHAVLLGHSGGATLMSGYQAVSENGAGIFQGPEKIIPCPDLPPLPAADGIFLLDSNWGNGAMTLLSTDPALTDIYEGHSLAYEYDLADSNNGYHPDGSHYSKDFIAHYQAAQGMRNNKIIDIALERLATIQNGKGLFIDDEPFCIAGASQVAPNNRMFPQDISLMNHTKNKWPLLHKDGVITDEIVYTRRLPRGFSSNSVSLHKGAVFSTVKRYLTNNAVRALPDYSFDETGLYGVDWDSCWCCTPGNVSHVTVPALIMGLTGSYEFLASETIYEKISSADKTIVFVEGASHNVIPNTDAEKYPGEFGDTVKTCFDYAAQWLEDHFH